MTRTTILRWIGWIGLSLGIAGLLPVGAADAQIRALLSDEASAAAAPSEGTTTLEAITARRAEVENELTSLGDRLEARGAADAAHLEAVHERLQELSALLSQQAELAAQDRDPDQEDSRRAPAEPSPFALNALYEAKRAAEQASTRNAALLELSRKALAERQAKLDAAERKRPAAEVRTDESDPSALRSAERDVQLRRLDTRIAREELNLATLRARSITSESELDDAIRAMREALAASSGDSSEGFAALIRQEEELRRKRESAQRRLETAELRLSAAQNRFAKQVEPPTELLEEIEALTVRRDAIRQGIALLDAKAERLAAQRQIWRQWETVLQGQASRDDLASWEASAVERLEDLEQADLQRQGRAADLRDRLSAIETRLESLPPDSRMRPVLQEQQEALTRLQLEQDSEVGALGFDRRLTERLRDDIRDAAGRIEPGEVMARGVQSARELWSYEITSVDGSPITVGSLVLALVLFGIGMWVSRRGATIVGQFSQNRFKLDAGAAQALQTLSFYVLLVSFTLLALRAVHFPLTAFTVLGGALAIGIGFGSQNVMNNFISGLILMLERPVRALDVVEVDGNHGTIEKIGARSTQIRSTDGRHIVVPNSFFLESNVVNWTLSDELIRAKVTVGVIYGSPTRLVEQLIGQVVAEDELVLDTPKPTIVFEEFGDNSLNFDVYFWVRARSPMNVRTIQSRVRFRIDDLFRENDLVIAFPQRDVHLDSVSPIEVRMVDGRSDPEK